LLATQVVGFASDIRVGFASDTSGGFVKPVNGQFGKRACVLPAGAG
jgi:hypothetical protein